MQAERRLQAWRLSSPSVTALPVTQHLRRYVERVLAWPAGPAALLVALAARLPYLLRSDFPLNDGGMFVAMSRDILAAHFTLPTFTSYNFEQIPFAYPPLGFYLLATLSRIAGLDLIVGDRYVPLLANLATVLAVAVLARALLGPGLRALIAPALFALVPRSYEWLIMGGGLTRSLGLFFAVSCVVVAVRVVKTPSVREAILCSLLAALALASHLEEGLFALYSIGLVFVLRGRSRRAILTCALIGLGVIALTAPWWGVVIARHGLAPFRAASLTSDWAGIDVRLAALGEFLSTPSLVLSVLGTLAVLGALICLVRGDVLLPLWLAGVFVVTPRSAQTQAALPLALLAAVAVGDLLVPGLLRVASETRAGLEQRIRGLWRRWGRRPLVPLVGLGIVAALLAVYWPRVPLDSHALESLPQADRAAMSQVASEAAPGETFLVLSSTWSWEEDSAGEWFPLLAERPSVITPQGAEWLPERLHARRVCLFQKIRDFAVSGKGLANLDTWAAERGVTYSSIYVSHAPQGSMDWSPLVNALRSSEAYTVQIDSPDVTVLQRAEPVPLRWPESGPLVVARDCQSLADQSPVVQQSFEAQYGGYAAEGWVEEHELALPPSSGVSDLLARMVVRLGWSRAL